MLKDLSRSVDNFFTCTFGTNYLRLVRDPLIHERSEYLVARIQRLQKIGLRILDVGCGSAIPLLYLDRFCREKVNSYTGIDLYTERLAERYKSVKIPHRFINIDLDEDWNLGTFDIVCCFEVIEHITNDGRLFRLLCSHLNKNGHLIITTPSKAFVTKMAIYLPGFDNVSDVQDGGHVRIGYCIGDFQMLVEQSGMKILSCDWTSRFDTYALKAYLKRKGTIGNLLYNLRYPRTEEAIKFCIGGASAEFEDSYYSIAVCFAQEQKGLEKLEDSGERRRVTGTRG